MKASVSAVLEVSQHNPCFRRSVSNPGSLHPISIIPGNIKGQAEHPEPVEDVPARCRGVGQDDL